VDEGTAYKLTTVAGESFWVVIPDELAPPSGVVAVPRVPIRVNADLTTAPARVAADRYCDDFHDCEVTVVDRVAVPSGVMTRWDDASGTIRDLDVTTVDLGQWTLVMMEPDATRADEASPSRGTSRCTSRWATPRLRCSCLASPAASSRCR
jgi:hypothetical protein